MTAIAFRRKNKFSTLELRKLLTFEQDLKACQTNGAAVTVLLTVSVPKEKPVPIGWSIYITTYQCQRAL